MRKIELPKTKSTNAITDADEEFRLERLDEFERFQFSRWLEYMAELCEISPSEVLAVLHFQMHWGSISNVKVTGEGLSYNKNFAPVGQTPIEIAALYFTADHWHFKRPIPDRPIIWNSVLAQNRANSLLETKKFMEIR